MGTPIKPVGRDAANKLDDIIMNSSDILREVKKATKDRPQTEGEFVNNLLIMASNVALLATDIILTAKNIKTE